VWRIRNDLTADNFKKKVGKRQKVPFSTTGFEGIAEKTVDEKTNTIKIKLSHSGGPMFGGSKMRIHSSTLGENPEYDDEVIENWSPHMKQSVVDEKSGSHCRQINTNIFSNCT